MKQRVLQALDELLLIPFQQQDVYLLIPSHRYLTDMKQRVLQALDELRREANATAARQRSNHPPAISMRAIAARAGEP